MERSPTPHRLSLSSLPATKEMFRRSLRQFSGTTKTLLEYKRKENPSYNELAARIDPIVRTGESLEVKRARLVYQSRKRGILESDLLLSRFAKKHLHKFNYEELDEYDKLLDEPDWDIYYWATKNYDVTPLPDKWKDSKILGMLQADAENPEKEIMRMPDLH
ncbi:succinate dehydrogenase assembly factor 2, mitochondrial [Candidozyma haemuli]|uniref:Succinate dehydrogenase assembly factor 2, mitochondrial n=1 Tax=Candidozyma haemuli TaxID=45357 RepID=A0A2V1ARU7_9ASCO|nr:succinate dehydrogenase assembly factor 2, mitochondrial [[Candida] haemuloni]PVH20472.1 succinate dehydrogenase assembly factor 2, mitochondrial [[Candida] haemuloni]